MSEKKQKVKAKVAAYIWVCPHCKKEQWYGAGIPECGSPIRCQCGKASQIYPPKVIKE